MKRKKLFASDFDHTLCLAAEGVTERCLDAVKKFRDEGNIFGIITGRNYATASYILNDYGKYVDFVTCMTGALALDGSGNIIFEYNGDGSALCEILGFLHGEHPHYLTFTDRKFTYDFDMAAPFHDRCEGLEIARQHSNFTQINSKYGTFEKSKEISDRLLEKFGDKVNPQMNGSCLDIPPAGVTKSVSVARLARHFGVETADIYTAGDNDNDVSMLKAFNGYSLPHGTDAAKKATKKIFPCVEEMLFDIMNNDRD